MDNKNFFRALLWALVAYFAWNMIAVRIWPPPAPTPTPTAESTAADESTAGTNGLPIGTNGAASMSAPESAGTNSVPTADRSAKKSDAAKQYGLREAESVETVQLGTTDGFEKSPYRMALELSNVGAALVSAQLSDQPVSAEDKTRYTILSPVEPIDDDGAHPWRSFVIEQLFIDDEPVDLADARWSVSRREDGDRQVAEFSLVITRNDEDFLELVRTYALPAQPSDTMRSDLFVSFAVNNLSDESPRVAIAEHGPVGMPIEERLRARNSAFVAVTTDGEFKLDPVVAFDDVIKKGDETLFRTSSGPEVAPELRWWGVGNLYFTGTIYSAKPEGVSALEIAKVSAIELGEGASHKKEAVTVLAETTPVTLPPGESRQLHYEIYLGPKDREVFLGEGHADYAERRYVAQIEQNYGQCTFNFLTTMMIVLLDWLENHIAFNYGLAIIILVVIVRGLLHPITKKTQVNMMRMQENMAVLQPKLEEVKKKYANDAARMQQETMKVYREQGVSPFGQMMGCLPMLLQMPIWIALYSSLYNNASMRCRGFILWIDDLTLPDFLVRFDTPYHVPIFGWELHGIHLLPLLVSITMFAQQKLMTKPKSSTPQVKKSAQAEQAEQMQKMMPYMSLFMVILFYKFPSGLNLYILTSSLIGALEQAYIRRHIDDIKEKEKELPPGEAKPKRKPPKWLEKIQKQVEDAQKLQSQRAKDKK